MADSRVFKASRSATDFTQGPILSPLLMFAVPIFFTGILQITYGAVDLIVVGRFCQTAEVSGVSVGSQFMSGIMSTLYGFAVAITVIMGQKLGEKDYDGVEKALSAGIAFFAAAGLLYTILISCFSGGIVRLMNTPPEARASASRYVRICGCGSVFILAYNLLGSIFRGVGDSKTPLMTVAIATVINVLGDLLLIGVFKMGAAGAAVATVAAQFISVLLSLLVIKKRNYGFVRISRDNLRPEREYIRRVISVGAPLSLQETLVTLSFLVIAVIVNSLGVSASAAAGIGGKICNLIMLISFACSSALSAFTAQNAGAQENERARKGLLYLMGCSFGFSAVVACFAFFRGGLMVKVFSADAEVISMGADYLRAYAIDTLLTCFLFCFIGYYNGYARSRFVMIQGLIGAFLVRIPFAWLMSRTADPDLFRIALATPLSSLVQIILCLWYYRRNFKKPVR